MRRRPESEDQGTVLVLTLGLVGVLLLLVAVVVDVSVVVLAKRAVASAADGAALAAAQSLDEQALYAGGLTEQAPLSAPLVAETVRAYAAEAAAGQPDLQLTGTVDGGQTATVVASRVVALPFAGRLGIDQVTVTSIATARAPLTPIG